MHTWFPGHWMHAAVQLAPVAFVLAAQVLFGQRWKLVLQAGTHAVPLQVTVPFVGAVHVRQLAPQASVVVLGTQVGTDVDPRRQ
jgi:hypothetical protein